MVSCAETYSVMLARTGMVSRIQVWVVVGRVQGTCKPDVDVGPSEVALVCCSLADRTVSSLGSVVWVLEDIVIRSQHKRPACIDSRLHAGRSVDYKRRSVIEDDPLKNAQVTS